MATTQTEVRVLLQDGVLGGAARRREDEEKLRAPAVVAITDQFIAIAQSSKVQLHPLSRSDNVKTVDTAKATRSLCFNHAGDVLLTGSDDKLIRAWSLPSCALLRSWEHHKKIGCVAFSKDDTRCLWADRFGEVYAALLFGGETSPILKLGHLSPISHLLFMPDGARLLSADREGHIRSSMWPLAEVISTYYLAHVSPLQVVLPLTIGPLLLSANTSGHEVCLFHSSSGALLSQQTSTQLLGALGHEPASMASVAPSAASAASTARKDERKTGTPAGVSEISKDPVRLEAACECPAMNAVALAFANVAAVVFARPSHTDANSIDSLKPLVPGAELAKGRAAHSTLTMLPLSTLTLQLSSYPLRLCCSAAGTLCVLDSSSVHTYTPAGAAWCAEPAASFQLSIVDHGDEAGMRGDDDDDDDDD